MIKVVAFDWNGTLLADTQTVVNCTNQQLKAFTDKKIDIKLYRETFEIPVNKFFENLGLDPKVIHLHFKEAGDIFHREYEKRVKFSRTRSGAKDLLKFLKSKKIKSVIFSNHAAYRIQEQLKRLKIEAYFDQVLGNDSTHDAYTIRGKEKRLIEYLVKNNIKTSQTLIVGDTDEEIIIGKEIQAPTVAITNGHSNLKKLKQVHPTYLISNLSQIKKIVTYPKPRSHSF